MGIDSRVLLSALVIFIFFEISIASASTKRKIIGVGDPWCPYTCSAKSDHEGILVDIVRNILTKSDFDFHYEEMPWKRAVETTRNGNPTMILGALRADAPDFVFSEIGQSFQTSCIFTRSDSTLKFKTGSDLLKLKLGVPDGYNYGEVIDSYVAAQSSDISRVEKFSGVDVLQKLVSLLVSKRIDAFPEDRFVADYTLRQELLVKKSIRSAGCISGGPIFAAISPKDPDAKKLSSLFTNGMKELYKNGTIKKIYARYKLQPPGLDLLSRAP